MVEKSEIINPLTLSHWDNMVLETDNYSFFHTSHWARVLSESYGYQLLYFVKIVDGKLNMLFPFMEINSFLTGKRGVSLPFTDYCEPIIPQKTNFQDAMYYLIEYAKKAGWKYMEIRGNGSLFNGTPPSSFYYGHTLDLSKNKTFIPQQATGDIENPSMIALPRGAPSISPPLAKGPACRPSGRGKGGLSDGKIIFSSFRDSTKRNIKKAVKEGVETNIYTSVESVREFYHLNCLTRREYGLPPQPWSFFKKIHDHIIARNLGFVMLASYRGKTIAGAVYFHFGDKALFKYGASKKKYQRHRANNLIMWEAIKWYTLNGYKSLCFGRTEPENKGLMQFKSGWGAKEHLIHYYKYDLLKEAFVQDSSRVTGFHNKIFAHMPIPLLKMSGALLYKHMG